jgi:phosphoribosyl-ATP pyrophosphohydrolase
MAGRKPDADVLARLFATIRARKGSDPGLSYTAKLLSGGPSAIARKLGEESLETVIAALQEDAEGTARESADLLYHLLVLWASLGIAPEDVWAELARREGVSGIAEKASRKKG